MNVIQEVFSAHVDLNRLLLIRIIAPLAKHFVAKADISRVHFNPNQSDDVMIGVQKSRSFLQERFQGFH